MSNKNISKIQFDKQAEKFSNWSVTKNIEYLKGYFDFSGILPNDSLLDVACGTGEFSLYCAPNINQAYGIDISDKMIQIAKNQSEKSNLLNTNFIVNDVQNLPYENNSFSIIACRSAFHHFIDYDKIFHEMIRCCKNDGRLSIQDIVSYENKKVNDFFENLEKEIDISHNKTLSKNNFFDLFANNNIEIVRNLEITVELNFQEYINHAVQNEYNLEMIHRLINHGINDYDISKYFIKKNNELFFKRNVFMILGRNKISV